MTELQEREKRIQPPVKDLRKRCPTCNRLEPNHRKWCITPVIRGEKVMETRKIEGEQSVPCSHYNPQIEDAMGNKKGLNQ